MIYCFSGTGNTAHAAQLLARRIGSEIHDFTPEELRVPEKAVMQTDDKLVVWTFPTYSWGVPPVVRQIIRMAKFDFAADAVHIALTTCGDDVGNLAQMFRREISARGAKPGAVFSVQMPNTYVMMKGFDTDSEELARRKIEAALPRIEAVAREINAGQTAFTDSDVVRGSFPVVKTSIVYPWFVRFDMNPKNFNVDPEICTGCGKCARVCPMINITYDVAQRPLWGDKCAFCTACYHACPVHAINWKKTAARKGQVKYFRTK